MLIYKYYPHHIIVQNKLNISSSPFSHTLMHKLKKQSLTGLQFQQYLRTIFNIFKEVAFHQIYMQNEREQLSKCQEFDPLSAFKGIDKLGHNKIAAFLLRSFLQLEQCGNFKASHQECQQVINALNKEIFALSYEDFLEHILPLNIPLRNKSIGRYEYMQVTIGTMSKVYGIKSTSIHKIGKIFIKQIEFYRQLLLRKQDFCQRYGGDLYTFLQALCKGKSKCFSFKQLSQFGRNHKIYFNQQEFIALYKRTKSKRMISPLDYDNIDDLPIQLQSLTHLLLAPITNLDVKQKIRIISGIPFDLQQPSYKGPSIHSKQFNNKIEEQRKMNQNFVTGQYMNDQRDTRDMRYKYTYPTEHNYRDQYRNGLSQKNKQWDNDVQQMGKQEIDIRYRMIQSKNYLI